MSTPRKAPPAAPPGATGPSAPPDPEPTPDPTPTRAAQGDTPSSAASDTADSAGGGAAGPADGGEASSAEGGAASPVGGTPTGMAPSGAATTPAGASASGGSDGASTADAANGPAGASTGGGATGSAGASTAGDAKAPGTTARPAKASGGKGGAAASGAAKVRAGKAGAARKASAKRPVPPPPGPGLVVGPVPVLARVTGGVALLAAALLLVAPGFPLARSGGHDLGGPGNLFGFVPALPLVATVAAAGVLAVRGALPRLALAALLPAGTLAAGLLLRTLALFGTGSRSTLDLPLGIGTSARYEVAAGLVLAALGYGVLVLAGVLAALAWPRTLMEDDGDLDPRRPRLAAWGLAVGVLAALVLGMAPYSSSIAPGTPTLLERSGLDLLGGLVLALGAMVWAVISATLRPRLAVVGAYAGLAAVLLSVGLASWLLVARSPAIGASAGGVGTLLAALAAAVLAWVALGRRGLRRAEAAEA